MILLILIRIYPEIWNGDAWHPRLMEHYCWAGLAAYFLPNLGNITAKYIADRQTRT